MSMAHGIESRVPLLDHALVELAATIPANIKFQNGELKRLLRNTFAQVVLSGAILWIGYLVLGVPYAALLAVLGGIVQLIPWLSVVLAPLLVLMFGLVMQ